MYYLNSNAQYILFQEAVNSEIYVDKSLLIDKVTKAIRTSGKYLCITRPRRFGKTVNANMLGAYYTRGYDSHSLFDQLAIAKTDGYKKNMNQHNVIHIDFSRLPELCKDYEDYLNDIITNLKSDLLETYPKLREKEYRSLHDMLRESEDAFIFILDEWDSVFYQKFMTNNDKNAYMSFLKGLLKDQPYVKLAYMTGVLPIAKYSSGSELNMFVEYNFMNDSVYEEYFGMSEDEVIELCKTHKKVDYEVLKRWYDGYYLSDGRSLFNPRSVSLALTNGTCMNYWTETGPMNEIAQCIEHNVDAVREDTVKLVAGIPIEVELDGYSAVERQLDTRDEILSAMVVYGFLSYHDAILRIPNYELMEKFRRVLSRDSMGEVKEIVDTSKEMLEATLDCDEQKVAHVLEMVHDREIPFLQYNDENALSCVITLCYLYARKDYWIEREEKSGKGYCDYLFVPKKEHGTAIILELKVGKCCEEAIAQIKEKNYVQKVTGRCDKVLLVGINYDKQTKAHQCKIEKI